MANKIAKITFNSTSATGSQWEYPDIYGITHCVTHGQVLDLSIIDNGITGANLSPFSATALTTTDGLKIYARTDGSGPAAGGCWMLYDLDAQQGSTCYTARGELRFACPVTGLTQTWKAEILNLDDVDSPTSATAVFADQFGNRFKWDAVTVA